jgi:hypothetical protein
VHKVTFSYNKIKQSFKVNSHNHHTQVLIPGLEVDEIQVTSPRPFSVEVVHNIGNPMPSTIKSKPIGRKPE